ncbi:DUF3606 domain-containing protein [Pedobacter sp. MC2016-14]|uniref:DUF3606 domain-containing protein n=1 Tax=Pedobacter sp. MC2016-14 TaxID=2897327 RepID=UPI001E4A494B|nr:DUF3606 domain-containing protein [Pedobacter sp. MC2016-14]MCD0489681.1 DUF3606 domain-containing protein [Pedobacter sp. MC2016-14]
MKNLIESLRLQIPEIKEVDQRSATHYYVFLQGTDELLPVVRQIDEMLVGLITENGEPEEHYSFDLFFGDGTWCALQYNDEEVVYSMVLEIEGEPARLQIMDLNGASGDFVVFDAQHESLGVIHCQNSWCFDDATSVTHSEKINPYLGEILNKIRMIRGAQPEPGREFSIDVNDQQELEYWAGKFQISAQHLKDSIHAAGNSLKLVTSYLQH